MKKRMLECSIHGLTLHRCKRRCWKRSSGKKDKTYADEYTEKCFKCILEGRIGKGSRVVEKKKKHIAIK